MYGTTSMEEDCYTSSVISLMKKMKTVNARKVALEHIKLVVMMEKKNRASPIAVPFLLLET